jgi:hypothetical protein
MKLYGPDGAEIVKVTTLETKGAALVVRGKVFGAMPLTAELRPEEARQIFRLLTPRVLWCILALMFRPASKAKAG